MNNKEISSTADIPLWDSKPIEHTKEGELRTPIMDYVKQHPEEYLRFVFRSAHKECLHDTCESCHGTGYKINGDACVHHISCPCPKHSVR